MSHHRGTGFLCVSPPSLYCFTHIIFMSCCQECWKSICSLQVFSCYPGFFFLMHQSYFFLSISYFFAHFVFLFRNVSSLLTFYLTTFFKFISEFLKYFYYTLWPSGGAVVLGGQIECNFNHSLIVSKWGKHIALYFLLSF